MTTYKERRPLEVKHIFGECSATVHSQNFWELSDLLLSNTAAVEDLKKLYYKLLRY